MMLPPLHTLCLTLWILVSGTPLLAKERPNEKKIHWSTVLALLNSEPEMKDGVPYSNDLEDNLLERNKQEMAKIGAAWKKISIGHTSKGPSLRLEENLFFQNNVEKLNAPLFKALDEIPMKPAASKSYREVALKALRKIDEDPHLRSENTFQFKDGNQIGFCFGRALFIHYWLLKEGVQQADLAKVFAFGELHVGKVFWNFHVAVWIKDPKDGFLVVDPLQKSVLSYKEWIKTVQNYDIKAPYSRIRFYMTSPRKFLPSFGAYHMKQLEDPHFKGYFIK